MKQITCSQKVGKVATNLLVLAAVLLNPISAVAEDVAAANTATANTVTKVAANTSTISFAEWQKYSHALPNPWISQTHLNGNPTNFSGGEFEYFNAKESSGFTELDEVSMSQIIAIAALVAGSAYVYNKIRRNNKNVAAGPRQGDECMPSTTPKTYLGSDLKTCYANGTEGTIDGIACTYMGGICVPNDGEIGTIGGIACTYMGGICVPNMGTCTTDAGVAGGFDSFGVCMANMGTCTTDAGVAGMFDSVGVCMANMGTCTTDAGVAGMFDSVGVCIIANDTICDNVVGIPETFQGGVCVPTEGAMCSDGGLQTGIVTGGVCAIDMTDGANCGYMGLSFAIPATFQGGVCVPTDGERCSVTGDGMIDGTITGGVCVTTALSCVDDVNHADRRNIFVRGSGVSVSGTATDFANRSISSVRTWLNHAEGGQFWFISGANSAMNDGIMRQARAADWNTTFTTTTLGVTYVGRFIGKEQIDVELSPGVLIAHGDRVALIEQESDGSVSAPTDADFIYRAYFASDIGGDTAIHLAVDAPTSTACGDVSGTNFFLADDYQATTTYAESRTEFSLRGELRRGLMNTDYAIKLDNFYFIGNAEFGNYHLEYRTDVYTGDSFNVYSDSGFKRQDSGRTDLYYTSATAIRSITEKAEVYLQLSAGEVASEIYTDTRLHGFALGMFADRIFRHNDSYHVSISQPFAATEVKKWELSADTVIGDESNYIRFGLSHKLEGKAETRANIFYTKEF